MALNINIKLNQADKAETQKKKLEKIANGTEVEKSKGLQDLEKLGKSNEKLSGMTKALGIQLGKKVITSGLSMVGTWGGDTAKQNRINNIVSTVETGMNAASTIAAGAALGGPIGAGIAAIGVAVNEGIQMVQRSIDYKIRDQENTQAEIKSMERLGLQRTDRGRGVR